MEGEIFLQNKLTINKITNLKVSNMPKSFTKYVKCLYSWLFIFRAYPAKKLFEKYFNFLFWSILQK